jgi:TPR repeat protein
MDKKLSQISQEADVDSPLENTQQLAEEGNPEAQFWVGFKFACAGTIDSYLLAGDWYRRAATQGHALAQFNLGVMYSRGQGLERDRDMSRFWLTKAAENGDCGAQYMLGMDQNRRSLDEPPAKALASRIEAYKWLHLAAAQGYAESAAGCDLVAMGMTLETVREGKRRAEAFVSDPSAGK